MSPASIILVRVPNDGLYGPIVPGAETVVVVDFAGPAFGGEFRKTGLFKVDRQERLVASAEGAKLGVVPAHDGHPSMFLVNDTPATIARLKDLYRRMGWDTIGAPLDEDGDWRDYRHMLNAIRSGRVSRAA